jgi:hypothetical protein
LASLWRSFSAVGAAARLAAQLVRGELCHEPTDKPFRGVTPMMGGTRKPPKAQPARVAKAKKIRRPATAKKSEKKEQPEQPPEYQVPDENRSD